MGVSETVELQETVEETPAGDAAATGFRGRFAGWRITGWQTTGPDRHRLRHLLHRPDLDIHHGLGTSSYDSACTTRASG